jgi:chemosensory pili system protein ChpA (sensor histidine kinase/response regulator)
VAAAKDVWSAVAGGEQHRVGGLAEQFSLLGDSVDRLFPAGPELTPCAADGRAGGGRRWPARAGRWRWKLPPRCSTSTPRSRTASSTSPTWSGRIRRLAQRIDEVRNGAEPQPLEPWMEELYRRVSDRQTMGSVVHELRASLSEVEKQIDQYFRNQFSANC